MARLQKQELVNLLTTLGVTGVGISSSISVPGSPISKIVIIGGGLAVVFALIDILTKKGHKVHKIERIGKKKFKIHVHIRKIKTARKSKTVDRKRLKKVM